MRKYAIKKANFEMNLAPLIDVVFLLLIFFMVASTLNLHEVKATIQLPGTDTVQRKEKDEIVLYVDKEGEYFLEDKSIQKEDFPDILKEYLQKKKTNQVTVYADRETDFQVIVNVLDVANQLNIEQLLFSLNRR